jgi:hypothetical protein
MNLGSILDEVTRSIWSTAFGKSLDRVPGDPIPEWSQPPVAAAIDLRGDWNGTLSLSCDPALASRLAATLFGPERLDLGRSEWEDAIRELVNIVGGNLKSTLGPRCRLSIPLLIPLDPRPSSEGEGRRTYRCDGALLMLRVSAASI